MSSEAPEFVPGNMEFARSSAARPARGSTALTTASGLGAPSPPNDDVWNNPWAEPGNLTARVATEPPQAAAGWEAVLPERGTREASAGHEVYGTRVPLDELFPSIGRKRESVGGREPRLPPLPPAGPPFGAAAAVPHSSVLQVSGLGTGMEDYGGTWAHTYTSAATSITTLPPAPSVSMGSSETSASNEEWAASGIAENVAAIALGPDIEDDPLDEAGMRLHSGTAIQGDALPPHQLSFSASPLLMGPSFGAMRSLPQDAPASPRSLWSRAVPNSHLISVPGSGRNTAAPFVSAALMTSPREPHAAAPAARAAPPPPSAAPPPPVASAGIVTAPTQQPVYRRPPPPSEPPPPPPAELASWQYVAARQVPV